MSTKTVMMRVLVGFGIWFVHGVWCFAASGACATGTFGEKISHRQVDPREAIQKAPGIDTLKNRSQVFSSLRKTFHFLFFLGGEHVHQLQAPGSGWTRCRDVAHALFGEEISGDSIENCPGPCS